MNRKNLKENEYLTKSTHFPLNKKQMAEELAYLDILQKEFDMHVDTFRGIAKGSYVLLYNSRWQAIYPSREEAHAAAKKVLDPNVPYLVKQIDGPRFSYFLILCEKKNKI